MGILEKGKDFGTTETVTSGKLEQLVTDASFRDFSDASVAYNGTTGTCLQGGGLEITPTVGGTGNGGGQLQIKDLGVIRGKIANDAVNEDKIADDSIRSEHIANNAINSANMITGAIIERGNLVADAIDGTKIDDDAVNTEHIADDAVENAQIADNAVQNAQMADNSVDTAEIVDDAVTIAKTDFIDSTTATLTLNGTQPKIVFNDTDVSTTDPYITGNSSIGSIEIKTSHTGSDIFIDANDVVLLRHQGNNIFAISDDVAKDASGSNASGAQVTGSLEVTGDIHCSGGFNDIVLKSSTPKITFEETDVSISDPYIQSFDSGNLEIKTVQANSLVRLDGKKGVLIEYDGSNTLVEANATAAKDAGGNSNQIGIKVHGDIYATGDISADGDVVASLSSDKRLKDNIVPIENATSKVKKLSGNTFDWNDKSKYSGSDVGVIAQEVQEIIPSAVKETEEGYLKVEYTKIVPLLIESIKELSAKVQELEAKVK